MPRKSLFITSLAITLFFAATSARAEVLSVTQSADSGPGTLRAAIEIAQANGEADEIRFEFDFTIYLESPLPTITTDIAIIGNGWSNTIIDGGNTVGGSNGVRAFVVAGSGSLTLDGVMVRNCYAYDEGGAVLVWSPAEFLFLNSKAETNHSAYGGFLYSEGSTTVRQSVVKGNSSNEGGGIFLWGGATLESSIFEANVSQGLPGGGVSKGGEGVLNIKECLFTDNDAFGSDGGGISTWGSGSTTAVVNSTFSGNSASRGGAIWAGYGGAVILKGVTISDNDATYGGGVYCAAGHICEAEGSILSGNGPSAAEGPDWDGPIASLGYNLIGDSTGATINGTITGNLIGVDPRLGPLTDNGGRPKPGLLGTRARRSMQVLRIVP